MELDYSKPIIMGILNVTPDSFSDGGKFVNPEIAAKFAEQMVQEGAEIIDIGGESSRPGSDSVSEQEELRRVLPLIKELSNRIEVPISIDTYKPQVAEESLKAGASIVNDISGLRNPDMIKVCAKYQVPVIIMHMKGKPKTMQKDPEYSDCVKEIKEYLRKQVQAAKDAGIQNIIIDPGIGFGKTTEHNLEILKRLDEFKELNCPILIGPSRKSFIGNITGLPVSQRLEGTIASVVIGVLNGANIVRVHDVKECKRALQIVDAIKQSGLREMTVAYIGVGSNLGDRKRNIADAIKLLAEKCEVLMTSSLYETEPVGYKDQGLFLNGVVKINVKLEPKELLSLLQDIEGKLKRVRTIKNGPRTIDLDILFYKDLILDSEELTLPHPRLHKRLFVLEPFAEIDPEFIHPILKTSIKDLISSLQ